MTQIPILSSLAKTRGWPYIIAWGHRVAGLLLLGFIIFHIHTLRSLSSAPLYDAKMRIYSFRFFAFLEWALAIPVIFHALNGGRLVLYECFEQRNDQSMIHWVLGLSALYAGILGGLMLAGDQSVSAVLFWLVMFAAGMVLVYSVVSKIWGTRHSLLWKLQRITSAFLLIMVPSHLLFMHLNPAAGKEASTVLVRMQNIFIKFVDLSLLLSILYHGGYGLVSVIRDYTSFRVYYVGTAVVVGLVILAIVWVGISLTIGT